MEKLGIVGVCLRGCLGLSGTGDMSSGYRERQVDKNLSVVT